jgi:hypothetical protein
MYFPCHYHSTSAPLSFYSSTAIAVSIGLAIDIRAIMKIFSVPVANYLEAWMMTKKEEQALLIFEKENI